MKQSKYSAHKPLDFQRKTLYCTELSFIFFLNHERGYSWQFQRKKRLAHVKACVVHIIAYHQSIQQSAQIVVRASFHTTCAKAAVIIMAVRY